MVSATPNANYVASGVLVPVPLAGDSVLEFCNTFAGWGEDAGREYLRSYEHLAVWARERGFVGDSEAEQIARDARARPGEAARVLTRAKHLRAALYAVAVGKATAEDRAAVSQEVELAAASSRLEWGLRGAGWVLPATLELPLQSVARQIGSFVVAPVRVGRCPGRVCGWLFADPRGRRRWCSMATCGNREKARRHAARAAGS